MKIRLFCPVCETPGRVNPPATSEWICPRCDHPVRLPGGTDESGSPPAPREPSLPPCAVCGNVELYRKKDFPHGLGMGILVAAILASTVTVWLYQWWLTWAILLGSAAFDGLLYLLVGDVIVCYRCHSEHKDVPQPERFAPFELTIHERYRQEKIRREELIR